MSSYEPSELYSLLSGSDALLLLEIIHKSVSCATEEDFLGLFPSIKELFPYDFAGSILGHFDKNNGLALTHGVNISFPEEWLNEFISNDYFQEDVATLETFKTYKLHHWSYLKQKHIDIPQEIKSLNMAFGVLESYCHGSAPLVPENDGSMFCFASPYIKQEKRTEIILEHLTPHLHQALSNVFSNTQSKMFNVVLSKREKEVLNWLKLGKSSWDISIILSISERTVNYHVYNIMDKLNASNRPQAVAIATRLGLVSLD